MSATDHEIKGFKHLCELIREDHRTNDGSILRPGFQALFVHRIGAWEISLKSKLVKFPLRLVYKTMHIFVRNFYGIELFARTRVGRRFHIAHQSGINIDHLAVIGDDCMVRQGVTLGRGPKPGLPKLGDRVNVGAGTIIAGGVTIGDDVTIGPNCAILNDVPANSFVVSPIPKIFPKPPADPPADA